MPWPLGSMNKFNSIPALAMMSFYIISAYPLCNLCHKLSGRDSIVVPSMYGSGHFLSHLYAFAKDKALYNRYSVTYKHICIQTYVHTYIQTQITTSSIEQLHWSGTVCLTLLQLTCRSSVAQFQPWLAIECFVPPLVVSSKSSCKHLDHESPCILSCCFFCPEFTSTKDSIAIKEQQHLCVLQAAELYHRGWTESDSEQVS